MTKQTSKKPSLNKRFAEWVANPPTTSRKRRRRRRYSALGVAYG